MGLGRRTYGWLDERLDLGPLLEPLRRKTVPRHRHSLWYLFGGMALTLMVVQILTGVLLMLYYRPTVEAAHPSVVRIMTDIPGGAMIRSFHSWGATLLVAVLAIHALSTLLLAAYRRPRELTWLTGCLLLALVLAFGFSGYLLPWNERAYFATRVGTDLAGEVPLIGAGLESLLRGGEEVGPDTLSRFFALHVAVLPGITLMLLAGHLWLIQRLGVSSPPSVVRRGGGRRGLPFFPDFALRDAAVALGLLVLLATLGMLWPAELGAQADPLQPAPEGIAPEWFFLFMFQTLKALPQTVAGIPQGPLFVVLTLIVGLLFVFLPMRDGREAGGRLRAGLRIAALALAGYAVAMTIYAWVANPAPTSNATPVEVPRPTADDWIAWGVFVALAGLTAVGLLLLARHREKMRRLGLLDESEGGEHDSA